MSYCEPILLLFALASKLATYPIMVRAFGGADARICRSSDMTFILYQRFFALLPFIFHFDVILERRFLWKDVNLITAYADIVRIFRLSLLRHIMIIS